MSTDASHDGATPVDWWEPLLDAIRTASDYEDLSRWVRDSLDAILSRVATRTAETDPELHRELQELLEELAAAEATATASLDWTLDVAGAPTYDSADGPADLGPEGDAGACMDPLPLWGDPI